MFVVTLVACTPPDEAAPEFSDAARYGLLHFDDEEIDALAAPLLALEEEIDGTLDMTSEVAANRALAIEPLDGSEVAGIEHPDRDPADAVPPCALARMSAFPIEDHVVVAMRDDLSPMEPNSPEIYARTLDEGGDCFADASCVFLRTSNDVLKQNAIMEVRYPLLKDYRWVDLGDGRMAVAARSWQPESAIGESGATKLWQSFTFEIFVPQEGDRTLRMMALWSESEFDPPQSDDVVVAVSIAGMDVLFKAHDEWLEENG